MGETISGASTEYQDLDSAVNVYIDVENPTAFPRKMIYKWCFSSTSMLVYSRVYTFDIYNIYIDIRKGNHL